MKETGIRPPEPESAACCDEPPQDDILAAAMSKAEQLLQILGEETEILKRFNNQALMNILPRKELLVRELVDRVSSLKRRNEESRKIPATPECSRLKARLAEIDELNRANQVFIEKSLAHFGDFLDCICPSNYGPGQDGQAPSRHKSATFKGLSFRKEV